MGILASLAQGFAFAGRRSGADSREFSGNRITAYLKNGGTLETAATMANHASTRTTQVFARELHLAQLRCARATPANPRCPPHLRLFTTRQGRWRGLRPAGGSREKVR